MSDTSPNRIADIRRDYKLARLDEGSVASDPLTQFGHWFDDVLKADLHDTNSMTLATVGLAVVLRPVSYC